MTTDSKKDTSAQPKSKKAGLGRLLMFAALGAVIGMGAAVAKVSRVTSYMSDAPETCINCHVMNPQYATWQHSSHANAATCNDCHVPHDTLFNHYSFKAMDGAKHATIFTLRAEPQVIELSQGALTVVRDNCIRCHEQAVQHVTIGSSNDRLCWQCHREVPHGRARSLSATPQVMRPQLAPIGLKDTGHRVGERNVRPDAKENSNDK